MAVTEGTTPLPGLPLVMEMQMSRLSPKTRAKEGRMRAHAGGSRWGGGQPVPEFALPTQRADDNAAAAAAAAAADGGGDAEGGDAEGGGLTIARAWLMEHAKVLASKAQLEARVSQLAESSNDRDALLDEIRTLTDRVITLETTNMELRVRAKRVTDAEAAAAAAIEERDTMRAQHNGLVRALDAARTKSDSIVASFKVVLAREKDGLVALDTAIADKEAAAAAVSAANEKLGTLTAELNEANALAARIPGLEDALDITQAELDTMTKQRDRSAARFAALRKEHETLGSAHDALDDAHRKLQAEAAETSNELRALRHSLWSRDVEFRELKRALKSVRQAHADERKASAVAAKKHKIAFKDAQRYAREELDATTTMLDDARAKLATAVRNAKALRELLESLVDATLDVVDSQGVTPTVALVDVINAVQTSLRNYYRRLQDGTDPDAWFGSDDERDHGSHAVALGSPVRSQHLVPVAASPVFVPSNTSNPKVRQRNFLQHDSLSGV